MFASSRVLDHASRLDSRVRILHYSARKQPV